MRGDRIGPRGPWRAPRELVELLEAHDARALVEGLELARAAACVAFGIGWLALHVARAPGVLGVVVEVVLVELAVIGAAALLVLEAHRTNAKAYARARARTSKTIRWRNPDETPEKGPPGAIRSGASVRVPLTTSEPRRRGARALGGGRDRFDLGRLDHDKILRRSERFARETLGLEAGSTAWVEPLVRQHDADQSRSGAHEEVLEVVGGGQGARGVHRPEGYALRVASASPDRGRRAR